MSKKVADPSLKLNREQILAVIVGGLAYTATAGVSYIIYMYYSMYQNATGFSGGQIGTIMSVISVIAIISYLFGGPLADKFRPKVLLVFCCLSTAVLACLMITFPPYELMLPLQALLALCALLPHWCPLSKFLTSLGKNSEQTNKIWGYYSAVVGATTAIVGFACSAILNHFDPRTGMRITVLIYVALEILCAILLPMVDKSKHSDQLEKSNDFSFRSVLELLKMPKVWLVYLSRTCLYMLGMAMMYLDPLMCNGFGVPLATIALITTIRGSFGIFTSPIAGNVAAKLHSSLKAHLILYGIAAAGLILLLVIPYESSTFIFALVGIATIEDTQGRETRLRCGGIQYEYGLSASEFANDETGTIARLWNPYVLLVDKKIEDILELETILTEVSQKKVPLLIIDKDAGRSAPVRMNPIRNGYLIAFDIGTTTVVCYLLSPAGQEMSVQSMLNPQCAYGADVISRIQRALSGDMNRLTASIRSAMLSMIEGCCRSAGVRPEEIGVISVVGNPCMQQLFLGLSPENLAKPPLRSDPGQTRCYPCQGKPAYVPRRQAADCSGYLRICGSRYSRMCAGHRFTAQPQNHLIGGHRNQR